ncbi:uncharacterized protein CIMG_12918 [Coccidioides immitis RS]|uniref:Uncharacterized protein n=1 Tax=Coccidioides immitis (strain RS) TaxID=246410 RepID=J3KG34_COCIM|nr:uncharacterized protein CIMG_12918 [Coccidioides immitis RS]EAS34662.3 hypothetical protein CIMG_12918 [Coccidioides immitis RS]
MNISDLRTKLCRMILNVYKLFETDRQKNNNHIFDAQKKREPAAADIINEYENGLDDLRLVDIKNINLEYIHDLTNKTSDVDGDNGDNRNNEANRDNRDDRDDKDNKDDEKSSPHVLENTEHEEARK